MSDASRTRVLLTGASGSMGNEAFLELLRRQDRYQIRLILRPSATNKKQFRRYEGKRGLEIVWGDLTNPRDVLKAVTGVDYVLHAAALISPAADRDPEATWAANYGSARNLIDAIRQQPRGGDDIRFVFIGSVAQYGDRLPPHEMINVGDPLKPSVHDYYALSKCAAESAVIESDLKHWVSMRQTFIAIPNTLSLLDGILFHQPIEQRIELITSRDAGYGLVQCIETNDDFWGRVYNMSGGPACRTSFIDYLDRVFRMLGIGDYRKVFDRNWFALRNFHCGYYEDSPVLNDHLGHFRDSLEDQLQQLDNSFPKWMKLGASACPPQLIRLYMKRIAEPLHWVNEGKDSHVNAFFGSHEAWKKIPQWDAGPHVPRIDDLIPSGNRSGSLPIEAGTDVHAFARSRGGRCLSVQFIDRASPLRWDCGHGHEFEASPRLLIEGGYWCPTCSPTLQDATGWNYHERVRKDPLLGRFHVLPD